MSTIYHIVARPEWEAAAAAGRYAPPSLASEGFIHLSTADQVVGVANNLYAGQTDLILLQVDEDRVPHPIVYEDCYETGMQFPHIYGEITPNMVIGTIEFPCGEDGRFDQFSIAD